MTAFGRETLRLLGYHRSIETFRDNLGIQARRFRLYARFVHKHQDGDKGLVVIFPESGWEELIANVSKIVIFEM
ncbi:hypothetical protein JAAARDRAFT_645490 [Jaapia argillacea MUCL 33604]|uniref:Uncharacterized protein n=1 Tax=Jaapia argillacea MUCL 33604 TaxID=933084 RepID=A0A067PVI9_9AGAM|nr:hypothetical protein JAAARDRAFT_645490 [Jaapia argillacea MUCL 33604]